MKTRVVGWLLFALLAAACSREQTNSQGNGPGNADGVGGREDPVTAPATGDPAGQQPSGAQEPSSSSQPSTPPPSQ